MAEREEQCATCGDCKPISQMRKVRVERLAARSYGRSSTNRQGNRHGFSGKAGRRATYSSGYSNSTSRRSSSRDITKFEDVWVCRGCKKPASYGDGTRLMIKLALVAVAAYFLVPLAVAVFNQLTRNAAGSSHAGQAKLSTARSATIDDPDFVGREEISPAAAPRESTTPPAEQSVKPRVVFAPLQEVVQPLPAATPPESRN